MCGCGQFFALLNETKTEYLQCIHHTVCLTCTHQFFNHVHLQNIVIMRLSFFSAVNTAKATCVVPVAC